MFGGGEGQYRPTVSSVGKEGLQVAPTSKHAPIQAPAKPAVETTNGKTESEADKLKARAERFGMVSEEEKKRKRQER